MRNIIDNTDDEFFHLMCHVDVALQDKIKRGEFVDLEELLSKTRAQVVSDEQRMQFLNRDGISYWIPAECESKISGIRKWDQAFRIYVANFCKSNPSRSAEIWQYIHVINTAAQSYAWENVSYYDLTFRRLMHERPNRSWSKIYNQIWNLAMCEPLNKQNQNFNSGGKQDNYANNAWRKRCW